ncbi:MAG: EF-Tu/IF-2/RF-3 family GTPase, partial [Bdellovibrionota bacterium]
VRPDTIATQRAKEKGVEFKGYNIVYNLVDDIKKAMGGLLKPTLVEKVQGRAEVRNVFSVPKMGNIGGCAVTEGKISRSDSVRLLRDNVVVYEGKIGSLRRFKDDVKEVAQGYECGIGIENYNDMKVGDVIEAFVIESITRSL